MDFIYIYEIELKPLEIAVSRAGRRCRGQIMKAIHPMYNVSLFRVVTMNFPCITNMS
jgi:hypothetical protein